MAGKLSRKAVAAQRRETALTLALAEATFQQIGDQLGVSKQRAHQIVKEALAETEEQVAGKADMFRNKVLARNNRMIRGLAASAQNGNAKAIETILKIQEQSAKVIGAFAPQKVAPTSPDGEQEWRPDTDPRRMTSEERRARIKELQEQLGGDSGEPE